MTAFAFGEQTSVREDSYQASFKRSRPDLPCIHVYLAHNWCAWQKPSADRAVHSNDDRSRDASPDSCTHNSANHTR